MWWETGHCNCKCWEWGGAQLWAVTTPTASGCGLQTGCSSMPALCCWHRNLGPHMSSCAPSTCCQWSQAWILQQEPISNFHTWISHVTAASELILHPHFICVSDFQCLGSTNLTSMRLCFSCTSSPEFCYADSKCFLKYIGDKKSKFSRRSRCLGNGSPSVLPSPSSKPNHFPVNKLADYSMALTFCNWRWWHFDNSTYGPAESRRNINLQCGKS